MLKIKNIELKPLSTKDTEFLLEMRNDLEIADNFFSDPPVYDYGHNRWLSGKNTDDLDFIIWYEGQRAGQISITKINYRHQKGEYGVMVHKDFRGKRIAYEASVLLLEYVFQNLPINKIYLEVFASNNRAIQLYEKIGFEKEGLFKDEFFKNGFFQDICRMCLLKSKWSEK
jgi:diamine N-acetyltransferase